MPEAIAAPIAAPAPAAPAAPAPAPKQTATPSPSTAPNAVDDTPNFYDALDDLAGEKKPASPKEPAKEKAEDDTTDLEPETKPVEKPVIPEKKTEAAKPKPWAVVHEKEKAIKERDNTIRSLQEKITKLETAKPADKTGDDPEKAALAKRVAELEEEVKYTSYEKSSEFQEQYQKPYQEAAQHAVSTVLEMTVVDPRSGDSRQATADDFWRIASIANTQEALEAAESLFGTPSKATYVMGLREQVRLAHRRAEQAKVEFKTKGGEREKQMQEARTRQMETDKAEFLRMNEEAAQKYPKLFTADETDAKGKELLTKGFEKADLAFSGKGNPALNSSIRMKAGAFNFLAYRLRNTEQALKDAEAKIAEYEKSEPSEGDPEAASSKPKDDSMESRIDALAAKFGRK